MVTKLSDGIGTHLSLSLSFSLSIFCTPSDKMNLAESQCFRVVNDEDLTSYHRRQSILCSAPRDKGTREDSSSSSSTTLSTHVFYATQCQTTLIELFHEPSVRNQNPKKDLRAE